MSTYINFTGPFDVSNWIPQLGTGGSIDTTNAPISITMNQDSIFNNPSSTLFCINIGVSGKLSFCWNANITETGLATGPTGPSQPGPIGILGIMGEIGPLQPGPVGEIGETGPDSTEGYIGYLGSSPEGPSSNVIGITGETGPNGELISGIQGNIGIEGPANTFGYTGSTGINPTGPASEFFGETGPQGPAVFIAGFGGPTGPTGETGPTGPTGPTGIGYPGEAGITGVTGPTGVDGGTFEGPLGPIQDLPPFQSASIFNGGTGTDQGRTGPTGSFQNVSFSTSLTGPSGFGWSATVGNTGFNVPDDGWYVVNYKMDIRANGFETGGTGAWVAASLYLHEQNDVTNGSEVPGSTSLVQTPANDRHIYSIQNTVLAELQQNKVIQLLIWSNAPLMTIGDSEIQLGTVNILPGPSFVPVEDSAALTFIRLA
jgi:hypothetical protein